MSYNSITGVYTVAGSHTYADEITVPDVITVTVNDDGGKTTTITGAATVADAALTGSAAASVTAIEGTPATLTNATFTDANPGDHSADFSGTIDWGDGSTSTFTSSAVSYNSITGVYTVAGSHTYADEITVPDVITVTVKDDGGKTTTITGAATVADAALTGSAAASVTAIEGTPATLTNATFTDANPGDHSADFSGTIDWGDGSTSTFTSSAVSYNSVTGVYTVAGSHTYADEITVPDVITVTVKDDGGKTTTITGAATVADAALTGSAAASVTATEGTPATLTNATFTDANPGDHSADFSGTIDWGDGSTSTFTSSAVSYNSVTGVYTVAGSHTYADEITVPDVITVTVKDDGGKTTTITGAATVADAALTGSAAASVTATEGTPATLTNATFTDANPGDHSADFSGTIDWGDGSTSTFTSSAVSYNSVTGVYTVAGSHTYADEITVPDAITVTVKDDGGQSTTITGAATVADAALTASGTPVSAIEGNAVTATVATFTDANPLATTADFTATITWGDGTTSDGTITEKNGVFSVTGTHTYAEDGSDPIGVTIKDDGGSTASTTSTATVAPVAEKPVLGGATSASVHMGALVTLGVTDTAFDSDDTLGNVTITSLPHDLSDFNGGTYNASSGTWTGTAAQFNALTFAAGHTTGTFTLSISAPNTTPGETATATENYKLTINSGEGHELPILGGATSATADRGGLVTLGVTETPFDSDDTLGNVTITSLPHDLSNFSGGTYTASSGTWTGTAAQFAALTFDAGDTAGTFTLSISAPNTTSGENATATVPYTLTINSALAAPSTPDLAAASDTGTSATDNITKDNTPTFTGTALAGSTVTIYDGSTAVGSAIATAGGTYSITTSALSDGTHSITAQATDTGGHTSAASGNLSVDIDTTAPNAPTSLAHSGSNTVSWNAASDNSGGSGIDHYLYQVNSGTQTSPTGSYTSTTGTTGTWTNPTGSQGWTLFVESVDVAGNVSSASRLTFSAPAGIAGEAINLALSEPSLTAVTVLVAGLAAGWSLSEGTNNGNGTWTVQASDLASLAVTTPVNFAGASVLNVTETWTNVDGSTGHAYVADNVEAFAPGSPIFALAGDDNLTGTGANDLFVLAQPIGNDVIYNFNAGSDKIDLIGFNNVAKFSDIQLVNDANGNAVITLGSGETITLHGTNAASLTAGNFLFDQTPVVENHGNMTIGDGAVLPLTGTIDNTGTIALNASGDQTELQIVGDGATLQGGGQLVLSDSSANVIVGATSTTTLTNVDNTISGAGQIGLGDGNLTLVNGAHGTIDANAAGGTLIVDTGHTVTNAGLLEASNGGTLLIEDAVNGSGSGCAVINGGTLDFGASSNVNVTFNNGAGTATYGELVLGNPENFCGQISGFTGTGPDAAHSDSIDLNGDQL